MFVDTLESRRLFTAAAPILVGGELRIFGDTGSDLIRVFNSDAVTVRVEVDGAVSLFAASAVTSVRANVQPLNLFTGTGGDDRVEVRINVPSRITGGVGNDILSGGSNADTLLGEEGNDALLGNAGSDTLDGGDGNNTLIGGDGNDTMTAGLGADVFDGGAGQDAVNYTTRTAGVNVSLDNVANDGQTLLVRSPTGLFIFTSERDDVRDSVEDVSTGSGNDTITGSPTLVVTNHFFGFAGNDRLDGGAGSDVMFGGFGDDRLLGREGSDFLAGGDGNDVLSGGVGDDALLGGLGNDTLTGGLGRDSLKGEEGDDLLFAQDGNIDAQIIGGDGFDFVERDANDPQAFGAEMEG